MVDSKKYPSWLKIKECKVVTTFDFFGKENGQLIDILNINDNLMEERKKEIFTQFYMATINKGMFKGLHVHPHKLDTLHCVHGKMCLAIYPEVIEKSQINLAQLDLNKFILIEMGEGNHKTVSFPSKYPHGFFGITEKSVVINYRNPAWTPDDNYQYTIEYAPIIEKLKSIYLNNPMALSGGN